MSTTNNWAEKNREYFNEAASTYNSKFSTTILQIIEEIQARREWIGVDWVSESSSDSEHEGQEASSTSKPPRKQVRLLDYACGTGLVSRALAPYVTQSLGIDISPSMVNEYNTGASNQGIPSKEMRAAVGNLIDPNPSPPNPGEGEEDFKGEEWWDFDVAAVGLGAHHFADPGLAFRRLGERLREGGVLFIIDFLPHGELDEGHSHSNSHSHNHGNGHSHGDSHQHGKAEGKGDRKVVGIGDLSGAAKTITHHGFSKENVQTMFEDAGVGEGFRHVILGKGIVFKADGKELRREVFMARGVKGRV